jgi:uncharacterized OB-fold protein
VTGAAAAPLPNDAPGGVPYQRCRACGAATYLRRISCRRCGSTDLHPLRSSGRGRVYAATAEHHRGEPPRSVVIVELDEGVRVLSTVEGMPAEQVRVGLAVEVEWRELEGGPGPVARPAGEDG